jgi:hypothetical protein
MKEELIIKKPCLGFSTLEMLIAMAILVIVISAVILISFSSQTMLIDSQTNSEALNEAQKLLENAQALARKDFKLVNPVSTTSPDGFYHEEVTVEQQPDFFTKKVTATVSWLGEHNRNLYVKLSALVTNFENAVGGDTCDSVLSPNADAWKTPQVKNSTTTDFAQLAGVSGNYPITDIDAYQNKLYITVGSTDNNTDPTFFSFDISDPVSPALLGKRDNDDDFQAGLNAVAVDGKYAYVASARGISSDPAFGQLQIIDISNPASLDVVYTLKVSGVTGTPGEGIGNSIFYKDGFVYLGLTKVGSGSTKGEFNIIDVHNFPTNPPVLAGSYAVGNTVNAIYVKGKYAYLATSNSQELIVLDVSDPSDILTWGYDATGGGNGKSLYLVGDSLYLASGPEFYILNNSDPENIASNNPTPPTINIGSDIDGLVVRTGLDTAAPPALHNLAFLLTTNNFQIWDITDSSAITQWSPAFLGLPSGSVFEPVFDCEGNNFFVGSNDGDDHGYLSVIAP